MSRIEKNTSGVKETRVYRYNGDSNRSPSLAPQYDSDVMVQGFHGVSVASGSSVR